MRPDHPGEAADGAPTAAAGAPPARLFWSSYNRAMIAASDRFVKQAAVDGRGVRDITVATAVSRAATRRADDLRSAGRPAD